MVAEGFRPGQETAVLCSGGLDSAVLVAHEARTGIVQPVYVSVGLAWEPIERRAMATVLDALNLAPRVKPPVSLGVDMRDVYPDSHWAVRGVPPAYDTPDEDVYIVGRNIVLLSKAAVFCAQRKIEQLAVGPLAGNPFPDATPEFFGAMERALSLGLDVGLTITAPFGHLHKADVIRRGLELDVPLHLTLSCMNPSQDGRHCGACSKCRERQEGFRDAGTVDATGYDRIDRSVRHADPPHG